jgi:hypothetical protein
LRLLNLDIDDLFLLSTPKTATSKNGKEVNVLELTLGDPINKSISNTLYFSGSKGWSVSTEIKIDRGSYTLKNGYDTPTVWDEGHRMGNKESLLFTGVYSKDALTLIANASLNYSERAILKDIKIIAGGYRFDITGTKVYNLVLRLPSSMNYEIDGTLYSCSNGNKVKDEGGQSLSLAHLVAELVK